MGKDAVSWSQLKKYSGQWVAIFQGRVLSHGQDAKSVYENALKSAVKPRIFTVPENGEEEDIKSVEC